MGNPCAAWAPGMPRSWNKPVDRLVFSLAGSNQEVCNLNRSRLAEKKEPTGLLSTAEAESQVGYR